MRAEPVARRRSRTPDSPASGPGPRRLRSDRERPSDHHGPIGALAGSRLRQPAGGVVGVDLCGGVDPVALDWLAGFRADARQDPTLEWAIRYRERKDGCRFVQARLGDKADVDAGARSRSRLHSPPPATQKQRKMK